MWSPYTEVQLRLNLLPFKGYCVTIFFQLKLVKIPLTPPPYLNLVIIGRCDELYRDLMAINFFSTISKTSETDLHTFPYWVSLNEQQAKYELHSKT